jgi:hypothetical protein
LINSEFSCCFKTKKNILEIRQGLSYRNFSVKEFMQKLSEKIVDLSNDVHKKTISNPAYMLVRSECVEAIEYISQKPNDEKLFDEET